MLKTPYRVCQLHAKVQLLIKRFDDYVYQVERVRLPVWYQLVPSSESRPLDPLLRAVVRGANHES